MYIIIIGMDSQAGWYFLCSQAELCCLYSQAGLCSLYTPGTA